MEHSHKHLEVQERPLYEPFFWFYTAIFEGSPGKLASEPLKVLKCTICSKSVCIYILNVSRIPGVARVWKTISRIMVLVKLENYVIMCMKLPNPLLQLLNHRKIHRNYSIGGISGIARVIITFVKMLLLMKIKLWFVKFKNVRLTRIKCWCNICKCCLEFVKCYDNIPSMLW